MVYKTKEQHTRSAHQVDCFEVSTDLLLNWCECVPDNIRNMVEQFIDVEGRQPISVCLNLPTYETLDNWMRDAVTPDSVNWEEVWRIFMQRDFREEIEEIASPGEAQMSHLFSRAMLMIGSGLRRDPLLAEQFTNTGIDDHQLEKLFQEKQLFGFASLGVFLRHVAEENGWDHLFDQITQRFPTHQIQSFRRN